MSKKLFGFETKLTIGSWIIKFSFKKTNKK
jgi:hypothetical protein